VPRSCATRTSTVPAATCSISVRVLPVDEIRRRDVHQSMPRAADEDVRRPSADFLVACRSGSVLRHRVCEGEPDDGTVSRGRAHA